MSSAILALEPVQNVAGSNDGTISLSIIRTLCDHYIYPNDAQAAHKVWRVNTVVYSYLIKVRMHVWSCLEQPYKAQ